MKLEEEMDAARLEILLFRRNQEALEQKGKERKEQQKPIQVLNNISAPKTASEKYSDWIKDQCLDLQ